MSDLLHLECVDPVVPISSVIRRLEREYEVISAAMATASWWQFKRRWIYAGACAMLLEEIDALLTLSASCQPVIGDMMRKRQA